MATRTSRHHVPAPVASAPTSPTGGNTLSDALAQERQRERTRTFPSAAHGPHGQSRLHFLIPACGRPAGAASWSSRSSPSSPQSQLMNRIHHWGATFLPKSGAAVARDMEARRRTPSPPAPGQVLSRHEATAVTVMAASVPERRPLREREELAAATTALSAAGPNNKPTAEAEAASSTMGPNYKPTAEAEAASSAAGSPKTTAGVQVALTIGGAAAASVDESKSAAAEPPITPVVGREEGTWLKPSPKKKTARSSLSLQTDISEQDMKSLADSPALSSVATIDKDKFEWADKYRPDILNEFICNKAVAAELYQMVVEHHCEHLIVEGPPTVGKRSMVLALIRDAFGPDRTKIEEQTKRFELKGEVRKHIDVRVRISEHHVEVNLDDLHGYEKYVITTLLNESIPSQKLVCDHTNCKAIVLHDANKLSLDLQHYIGWFLGRYSGCNRIIFCCSDASNLEAVKHLCKVVTLQPPSSDEIIKVLEYIATQEKIDLSHDIAKRITASASNNLRQAIRSFEATWKANYSFKEGQPILTGWEEDISNVARNIMEEPCPKQLFVIRAKIKRLIEHDISPHFILSHLVAELKRDKDEEFQNSIDELASGITHCKDCKLLKETCKECKSREESVKMSNINIEGFTGDSHDHGETIQCFIKIEEFTVRFMSFYRSLIAKNSKRGGAL